MWVFIFPNTCSKDCLSLLNGKHFEKYRIFQTVRLTPRPPIWEENGGASYSPNVAYLAGGVEGVLVVERYLVSYFRPLKPRHVLWSEKCCSIFKLIFLSLREALKCIAF